MKKIIISMAIAVISLSVSGTALAEARDCDANAIMWCGAYTKNEFIFKMGYGDGHNAAANLQTIYAAYGINKETINASVDGSVTKDGKIIVGGKTVATDAKTIGRSYMPGSIQQNGVWLRPTSVSFRSNSLDALVYIKDGLFKWAVIKSCGNVTVATPVVTPKPTPTPAPVAPAPPTPAPVLPETGMDLPITTGLGATSIAYVVRGYIRSKHRLERALRHK